MLLSLQSTPLCPPNGNRGYRCGGRPDKRTSPVYSAYQPIKVLHGNDRNHKQGLPIHSTLGQRGSVESSWSLDDSGPAKRIYHITDEGKECLAHWIDTLEDYRQSIGKMLEEAHKVYDNTEHSKGKMPLILRGIIDGEK